MKGAVARVIRGVVRGFFGSSSTPEHLDASGGHTSRLKWAHTGCKLSSAADKVKRCKRWRLPGDRAPPAFPNDRVGRSAHAIGGPTERAGAASGGRTVSADNVGAFTHPGCTDPAGHHTTLTPSQRAWALARAQPQQMIEKSAVAVRPSAWKASGVRFRETLLHLFPS